MTAPPPPPPRPPTRPDPPTWQTARDVMLFLAGLALLVHETVLATGPRTELLVIAAAMLGLPAVLRLPTDRS
ncbi:hypothetical protein [Euzebya rosea]|uniref:hypothetical protein n=1 Tax=Euzebya rosea TaxID=2052804 RepID=UPI0013004FCA|nr:hypothetical protein [Euzebya rosea]